MATNGARSERAHPSSLHPQSSLCRPEPGERPAAPSAVSRRDTSGRQGVDDLLDHAHELIDRARVGYRSQFAPMTEVADDEIRDMIARSDNSLICTSSTRGGRIQLPEKFHGAISWASRKVTDVKILYGDVQGAHTIPQWQISYEARSLSNSVADCIVIDSSVMILGPPMQLLDGRPIKMENEWCAAAYDALFRNVWELAKPKSRSSAECSRCRITTLIIRCLAEGSTDEVSAPKLGMSVRTYRRHIARIMDELQVTSRFQVGMKIAHDGVRCQHG